jgi:DNA invertase Pin-like site-specific DNA recombinase
VPVVFGDLPEVDGSAASRLIVQVMASFAEFERRHIGDRTKEALQALKARGVKLGTPRNLDHAGRVKGSWVAAKNRTAKAFDEMSDVAELAVTLKAEGKSLRAIAKHLDQEGFTTREGSSWKSAQVLSMGFALSGA